MEDEYHSIYEVPIETMEGARADLKPYQHQVMLIVNVASRCGFTPQYAELEALQRDYQQRGFSVLGFPCNQFFHQEPGSHQEIKAFADSCYNISFPLFAKINVKGPKQAPLYDYLSKNIQKKPLKFVPWNFTKFLVDTQGNVLKQYLPMASFKKIRQDIEALLPQ
ncbi:glutathione peroxidase [Legionella clemsonensis]|uniref:Glutathione peroxidase n=1 Tax=Legionella clemsonensis TaxID=1867846 RepID=A0A222P3G7_9GAMM|nr:glutathione peroxidase [Legionella clemsonensis]ASQ46386.1 Hydroperoxy fatty acid reductase gpx1 [Legionella clemsonensis]